MSRDIKKFPVAMRPGETPVPIPNTTVKTRAADGTALETAWESRRLPEFNFCTLKTAYMKSLNTIQTSLKVIRIKDQMPCASDQWIN